MPRSIHDIDVVTVPVNRRILGKNRDAALTLLIIGIHDTFDTLAARLEGPRLMQQLVDQSRLAMVNVRDNRNISNLLNHSSSANVLLNKFYPSPEARSP